MSSQFKSKLESLRLTKQKSQSNIIPQQKISNKTKKYQPPTHQYQHIDIHTYTKNNHTNSNSKRQFCSADVKIRGNLCCLPREQLCIQQPIVICKKEKKEDKNIKDNDKQKYKKQIQQKTKTLLKKVQPFTPIQLPISPKKPLLPHKLSTLPTQTSTSSTKKQIQIHIQKQPKSNQQCLKKLFKKIHKLQQQLIQSQKQRIRLSLQLNNLKDIDGINREYQKNNVKMEGQNYKLRSDVDFLKELLKEKEKELEKLRNKVPEKIVKEIVVEKPVEVRVEVPKYVPGPEKIVQVPKYVENKGHERQIQQFRKRVNDLQSQLQAQRKRYNQLQSRPSQPQPPTIIQKPVYLDKPIYIDRPVYIQKPTPTPSPPPPPPQPLQIPIQIPYQIPVYIQKPIVDDEIYMKITQLQNDLQIFIRENQELRRQNMSLKVLVNNLECNMEVLRRHNCQKNHEVEGLLRNVRDYEPVRVMEWREMRETRENREMRENREVRDGRQRSQKKVSWDSGVRDRSDFRGGFNNNLRSGSSYGTFNPIP